jgi:hypothetical protein
MCVYISPCCMCCVCIYDVCVYISPCCMRCVCTYISSALQVLSVLYHLATKYAGSHKSCKPVSLCACVCLRAGQPALFLPLCVIQCAKCANIFPYTLHVLLTRGSSICGCSCIVLEKCDRRGGRAGLLFCGIIFVASSARTVPATRRIALRLWPRDFISGGS